MEGKLIKIEYFQFYLEELHKNLIHCYKLLKF